MSTRRHLIQTVFACRRSGCHLLTRSELGLARDVSVSAQHIDVFTYFRCSLLVASLEECHASHQLATRAQTTVCACGSATSVGPPLLAHGHRLRNDLHTTATVTNHHYHRHHHHHHHHHHHCHHRHHCMSPPPPRSTHYYHHHHHYHRRHVASVRRGAGVEPPPSRDRRVRAATHTGARI
jgi:hypothetical protein